MDYSNWEADKMQMCVCDAGFEGADCASRSCPRGRDPTRPDTLFAAEEVLRLQCQADSGYFSLLMLGQQTGPIPHDADPAYLKSTIEESIALAGDVRVEMRVQGPSRLATVCGTDSMATTKIYFESHLGVRPPILVNRNTSSTRKWRAGGVALTLGSGAAVLRMETRHVLACPVCLNCRGMVYFAYLDSVSAGVNITATGAASLIRSAVMGLSDLVAAGWTNLKVDVVVTGNSEDTVCSATQATSTRVSLYSDYGNIPALSMLDGTLYTAVGRPVNMTFTTSAGNGTLTECSSQGVCNHDTGTCECFSSVAYGETQYRAQSSNGRGRPGMRGRQRRVWWARFVF